MVLSLLFKSSWFKSLIHLDLLLVYPPGGPWSDLFFIGPIAIYGTMYSSPQVVCGTTSVIY